MRLILNNVGQSMYRNPFKPNDPKTGTRPDGHKWKVIGADYSSQEIVCAAVFAEEQKMLDSIKNGWDMHSVSASLLFPKEWKELGGEIPAKGKPTNKELLKFRSYSKSTTFGLFYGMSAIGLADGLGLCGTTTDLMEFYKEETSTYMFENHESYQTYCDEYKKGRKSKTAQREFLKQEHEEGRYLPDIVTGDDLVQRFYKAYPKVRQFLLQKGESAKTTLRVANDGPFKRIRFFTAPEYESGFGSIERQAMNFPIQSVGADMTKYAIVLLKKHIEDNGLQDKLQFCLPIHDEIQAIAREDFAEEGLKVLQNCMEKAGEVVLGNRLQKTTGEVSDFWVK